MSEKIVLIDGHSILHRAFYGVPPLTNSKGMYTNAIYGFLNIMLKVVEDEKPDYLAVAFDKHAPTFRHKLYKDYKGTRKPMPEEMRPQVPKIKEVLKAMDILVMEKEGLEADDLLGTMSKISEKAGLSVSVVSGDRDLLQIATENIKVMIPKTKQGGTEVETYFPNDVLEKYKVMPKGIIDLKALMGDSSDNIPGVPKVGEKTATNLLIEYKTLDGVYENIDKISKPSIKKSLVENEDLARLSYTLATIKLDAEIDFNIEDAKIKNFYNDASYKQFSELELKKFLGKFDDSIKKGTQELADIKIVDYSEKVDLAKKLGGSGKFVSISFSYDDAQKNIVALSITGEEVDNGDKTLVSYYIYKEQFDEKDKQISLNFDDGSINDEDLFCEKISHIIKDFIDKKTYICVFGLQQLLHKINIRSIVINDLKYIIDTKLMYYEIDPLKSEYTISDICNNFGECDLNAVTDKKKLLAYSSYGMYKAALKMKSILEEKELGTVYQDIDLPLAISLSDMEKIGIRCDGDKLKEYSDKLGKEIAVIEQEIIDECGESFNINSPKQLGTILFEKLKLPVIKKTKTGYSTSADVLDKLSFDYPIVKKILKFRTLSKLKSTYADGLTNFIDETGRIHGKFHQTITATGRISSSDPNLQNIPIRMKEGREIRKVFLPRDGYVLLDADYSQIELRILAHMSKDENLLDDFRNGKDIHKSTASKAFNIPFDEVTQEDRRKAKAINFGIVYGMSAFGLGEDLKISRKEAKDYIDAYFETYPKVKEFLDRQVEYAKKNGYVKTIFGRIRPIPEINNSNFMRRSFGERVAMNSPIQGSAADIMKKAMYNVGRSLEKNNLKSRITLQVHDELLVETLAWEKDIVKEILTHEMQSAVALSVPLTVDVGEGYNWLDAH